MKTLEVLCPGCQHPNKKKLASSLLDRVYEESHEIVQKDSFLQSSSHYSHAR